MHASIVSQPFLIPISRFGIFFKSWLFSIDLFVVWVFFGGGGVNLWCYLILQRL